MCRPLGWLVLGAALVLACGDNAGQAPTGTVTGTVTISGAAEGSGVLVTAAGPTSSSVVTSADGSYTFSSLELGTYTILATAPSTLEHVIATTVDVSGPNAVANPIDFVGLGSVRGSVTRAGATSGNAGIIVVVAGTSGAAITDDAGAFAIDGVPAGEHAIVASSAGFAGATSPKFVVAYRDEAHPAALALQSTAATGAIAGHVVLDGETDHHGIAIALSGPASGAAITDVSGAYAIGGLPDGTYTLTIAADSTTEGARYATATVSNGQQATAGDVHLTPVGRLTGTVSLGGSPAAHAGTFVYVAGGPATITSDTGAFELVGVTTGMHTVQATHTGYADGSEPNQLVTYRGTTQVPAMTLAASSSTSTVLSGRVLPIAVADGSGTTVTLRGTGRQATTSLTGAYQFDNLPAGVFTVDFDNGLYGASVPNVITLAGGHGFLIENGQLVELPDVEMPRGKRVGTSTAFAVSPARTFFYAAYDANGILVADADGTVRTLVGDADFVTISNDDALVGYRDRQDGTLRFVPPQGGTVVTQALEDSDLVWLAPGHSHYVARRCTTTCDLYAVAIGGAATALGINQITLVSPAKPQFVSRSTATGELTLVSLVDATKTVLGTSAGPQYFSPDGEYVVYRASGGLAVHPTNGSGGEVIAYNSAPVSCEFSVDSTYVACRTNAGVTAVVELATGQAVAAPFGYGGSLSADNASVVLDQRYAAQLEIASASTGAVIQDITSVTDYKLTPDHSTILVTHEDTTVGAVPANGGSETLLATAAIAYGAMTPSPDSALVAIYRGDGHLLLVPTAGGAALDLGPASSGSCAFSPDSSRIVWNTADGITLTKAVASGPATAWNRGFQPKWSTGNALLVQRTGTSFYAGYYVGVAP